ncbi:hypothetical protein F5Y00DRAFT_263610 [Daldinia vernicosa]|uniref:uncharacterized protein n=1 Tax=Daldinia vernicosa TaxID=114800 RepID=UPI0020086F94|nr:uncharacterized protein F5Y00DRAFT_263610 [Daldinia vernicosa]KAI0847459.1 hypothetical protein F5Y00DRAFT_263610 [Daldinia vernicosa]
MSSSGSSWPRDGEKNDGSAGDRSERRTRIRYNSDNDGSPRVESEGEGSESEQTESEGSSDEGGSSEDESSHDSDDGDSDDNSDSSSTDVNSTASGDSSDSRFSSATTLVWNSEDDE